MRLFPAIFSVASIVIACGTFARAQAPPTLQLRIAARQELELAKIELQNYWQIEYPRQRRELNAAIELAELELENNRSLLHEYQPFTQFSIGQPFPVTVRNLQMCIREGELRLCNLQSERSNLIRFHGDQFRVLEMKVQAARLRLAELEANDEVASDAPVSQP